MRKALRNLMLWRLSIRVRETTPKLWRGREFWKYIQELQTAGDPRDREFVEMDRWRTFKPHATLLQRARIWLAGRLEA